MHRPPKAVLLATILLPGLLAFAGGWAVVSLEDPPEFGVAGTPLLVTFAVRQHGITPLEGLRPVVEARSGNAEVRVNATAASGAGRYVASLVLPEPGNWDITIRSGFGNSKLSLLPLRALSRGAAAPAPLRLIDAQALAAQLVAAPRDVAHEDYLAFYARRFSCCELTFTSYRFPTPEELARLLEAPESGRELGERARRVVEQNRGASQRTLAIAERLLASP